MSIDQGTVRKIAELARIHLSAAEVEKFSEQLREVLSYVEQLRQAPTDGVEPLTHPLDLAAPLRADDGVTASPGAEVLLAAAPDAMHGGYKVPQVL